MDHIDFGRYLSQQRELRGLTREDVSRVTKISPSLIAALEEGQVERLPARIFVLNYIRAYAQVIGLSPEDAMLRYQEMDQAELGEPGLEAPGARRRRGRWRALALLVALVAGVGAFLALVLAGRLPPGQGH